MTLLSSDHKEVMNKPVIGGSAAAALLVASALLLSFGVGDVRAQTWKTYTAKADGFQADFSGTVQVTPLKPNPVLSLVHISQYEEIGSTSIYSVIVARYTVAPNLEKGLSAFDNYQCKTTNKTTLQLPQGQQGVEISGTNCMSASLSAATKFITVGDWLYQVTAVFPATDADNTAAQHFLDSFKVNQR
jgi:hypothetical protein